MAYLKSEFCGARRYIVRVIEYQRRGLPHAHIVLAVADPPQTAESVDLIITCELSKNPAIRALQLKHMLHTCNHGCHPDDPTQECIKGCPWPFLEDTHFDVRGYPHHRRRPCDGTCPNCSSKKPVLGRRSLCVNRLLVETAPSILARWDGHANVKFAGSVNLFEYLYKYLFKGPDTASYEVTSDPEGRDAIRDWQRGRYLVATECAWRVFGYTTYERVPHILCLPVHTDGEDWIQFLEGHEEEAVTQTVSPLQRYFYRPPTQPYLQLKYHEYYEFFMVSAVCPVSLKHFFPNLFACISAGATHDDDHTLILQGNTSQTFHVPPTLDSAPSGQKHFVYRRLRGEPPLCRLEMKFPRQKEVFYLRHILLNYPKVSFEDCRRQGRRVYPSYEEALLATGLFSRTDEATYVLKELVELRYTAAQLRFAFLVLLEQDARPITLYKKFESPLMKDFLDRGLTSGHPKTELQRCLRASWLAVGHTEESWQLPATVSLLVGPTDTTGADQRRSKKLYDQIRKDPDQKAAAEAILKALDSGKDHFLFVQGRAGSGKTTVATYANDTAHARGKAVINVATTGIAALLLPDGATAHSVCKIPLEEEELLTCNLGTQTEQARRLAHASLLQWDEWPSAKRSGWDAVLRLLETLREAHGTAFKAKVIVCYGDFRQIPPVLRGATRESIVRMSVCTSASWPLFQRHVLRTCHRQKQDAGYAAWIETIGNGTAPKVYSDDGEPGYVDLSLCRTVDSENAAIAFCFPNLNDVAASARSKILSTTNAAVDIFNHAILDCLVHTFKLREHILYSADTIDMDTAQEALTESISCEFLHVQIEPGTPPHRLRIVIGALYELMRNFSPDDRLMNHTKVVVRAVHERHVLIETLDRRRFPLPRICFRWRIAGGTATMVRKQVPLRPAYASTYNGAQASTLGHLYVALSRVQHRRDIRVLPAAGRLSSSGGALTKNVVWPELLLSENRAAIPHQSGARKRPASSMASPSKLPRRH